MYISFPLILILGFIFARFYHHDSSFTETIWVSYLVEFLFPPIFRPFNFYVAIKVVKFSCTPHRFPVYVWLRWAQFFHSQKWAERPLDWSFWRWVLGRLRGRTSHPPPTVETCWAKIRVWSEIWRRERPQYSESQNLSDAPPCYQSFWVVLRTSPTPFCYLVHF